jgi:hypothetical protein
VGSVTGAGAEATAADARRWAVWLMAYKKRCDQPTHVDLAELPEAMRRAGRPGPKP